MLHKAKDSCELDINSTVVIPLKKYKLNKVDFKEASLTITGDYDFEKDKLSEVTIKLP